MKSLILIILDSLKDVIFKSKEEYDIKNENFNIIKILNIVLIIILLFTNFLTLNSLIDISKDNQRLTNIINKKAKK